MSDEHDSWFQNVFGVDLGGAAQKIKEEAKSAVTAVSNVVTQVETKVSSALDDAVNAVSGAVSNVVQKVTEVAEGGGAGGGGLRAAGPAAPKPAVAGGGTGKFPLSGSVGRGGQNAPNDVKAVQRALGLADDGQCGDGTITAIENYQRSIGLEKPDGRVDAGGGTERALAGGAKPAAKPAATSASLLGSLGDAASSALDWANDAGKAVAETQVGGWEATKGAYKAVTGVYDAIVPSFAQANKDLGKLVDMAEGAARKGNDLAVAQYGDVPVLGAVVKASSAINNTVTEATGGLLKGAGDLTAMAGDAIYHPIDAASSMAEGLLGIAENVPSVPGMNTTVRAAHGLFDLARGNENGEYGSSLEELAQNLLDGTHRDPNDPSKKSDATVDFLAGMGGGTKVWKEKPAEAAVRTLVNIAPMLLGDEAAAGNKPQPKGGSPKGGPPAPEGGPPKGGPPSEPPSGGPPSEPPSSGPSLGAEIDAAFDSGRANSGTMIQFTDEAGPLGGSGPKQGAGDIWYHDNIKVPGAGPEGTAAEVRTHSANPNAPDGAFSKENYTTQINSKDGRYRLPNGEWKRIEDVTAAEKAAAHIPAGN